MTVSRRAGVIAFLLVLLPVSLAMRPVRSVWSDQDYIHHYDVVTPTLEQPSDYDGTYLEKMTILLKLEKEMLTLELTMNKNILRPNFKYRVQQDEGEKLYEGKENCYYHGRVEEHPDWSVAVSTCYGIRGTFGDYSLHNMTFFIEPLEDKVNGKHMVYRASELPDSHFSGKCGSDGQPDSLPDIPAPPSKDALSRKKRQSSTHFLELYVATDTAAYAARGNDRERLLNEIVEIVNLMDDFYNTFTAFKVRMALIEVQAFTTSDPITINTDSSATLTLWKEHFRNNIHQAVPADAALLFVGNGFANSVLGIAPVGAMCSSTNAGLATLRSTPLASATTAAHELGHMFGLDHDDASCSCADSQCIMSAVISTLPTQWSSCSQTMFAADFTAGNFGDRCLSDEPTFVNTNNVIQYVCGNGIREPGEGCDCGSVQECTDPCCNATACTLSAGAVCYTHEPCCQSCQYRSAGVQCRAASGECDVREQCTGNSGECPDNIYMRDGTNCTTGAERGYCIDGQCLTRNLQCQRIYGDSGVCIHSTWYRGHVTNCQAATSAPDVCYDYNTVGNCYGKCGVQQPCGSTCTEIPCAQENVLCGIIRCVTGETFPEISTPSGTTFASLTCPSGGVTTTLFCLPTYSAEETDPAFVQDLTKCGENKVCMGQRCVDANFAASTCASNAAGVECSGQGVCLSDRSCLCNEGWFGETCDRQTPTTTAPTTQPTTAPTTQPTTAPTTQPTTAPTTQPTTAPTTQPTTAPTTQPTTAPTTQPATNPTVSTPTQPAIPCPSFGGIECSGNGECASTGTCLCDQGWLGSVCNVSACPFGNSSLPCSGRGVCTQQGVCACDNGWAGVVCDADVSSQTAGSSAGAIAGGVIVALLVVAAIAVAAVLIFIFLILPKLRAKSVRLPRSTPKASSKPKQHTNGAALTSVPHSTKPVVVHLTSDQYNGGPADEYHDYQPPPYPSAPPRRPAPVAPVRQAPNRPSPAPPSRPSAPPLANRPAVYPPPAPSQPPAPKPSAPPGGFKPTPKPLAPPLKPTEGFKPTPKPLPASKPSPKPLPAAKPSPRPPPAAKPSPQPAAKPVWPPTQNHPTDAPKPSLKPVWPPTQNPPTAAPKPATKPVWPPPASNGSASNPPPPPAGKKPMLPPSFR